jgi:hypothetical protein
MAGARLTANVMSRPIRHHGHQTERDITMATTGQAISRRSFQGSVPRVATVIALAGGMGLGLVAGRSLSGLPASAVPGTVEAAAPRPAEVAGLVTYRTTEASLRAAMARNDTVAAAHFRAQLGKLSTPAIVSALAHERVDLELGMASAAAWHDPRMAAEFRSRLAAQVR